MPTNLTVHWQEGKYFSGKQQLPYVSTALSIGWNVVTEPPFDGICCWSPGIWSDTTHHYIDVIMSAVASQITSLTIVQSIVYSVVDERKLQSCASLAFVWGIHHWPVNSPRKWPVTRKMFPLDDVIMSFRKSVAGISAFLKHTAASLCIRKCNCLHVKLHHGHEVYFEIIYVGITS